MTGLLTLNDAMDIVDAYGADDDLWPRAQRAEMLEMRRTDEDFADFVKDAKRLDAMLENWEVQEDGLDVGDTGDDWDDIDDDGDDEDEGNAGDGEAGQEDDDSAIELNPDRVQDMEEMFSGAIQKFLEECQQDEFRVFTRDNDKVVDIVGVTDTTSMERIDLAVAKSTGPLQKDLRRLIASRSQVRRSPGQRSGRLHAPNLHRILSGDDRVFTRREEADSLDTAVSLVIDCSGSMSGAALALATETAYSVGKVLNSIGIAFECLGFTDSTNDPCMTTGYMKEAHAASSLAPITRYFPLSMPKFKTFDERWTHPVQRRFAHVYNNGGNSNSCGIQLGYTPEGCGMEFAARRLLVRGEARKIMLVMTDGSPGSLSLAAGYSASGIYQKQSVEMVKAIELAGIDLVGIGIKHNGPAGYYTNHMCIQNIEEMPAALIGLLKRFIVG